MEYTITRTQRNVLILCSSLLILLILITRFLLFMQVPTRVPTSVSFPLNAFYVILYAYIVLTLYRYFGHYKLKSLQICLLVIFITEVIYRSSLLSTIFGRAWGKAIVMAVGIIWLIATLVTVVLLFEHRSNNHGDSVYIHTCFRDKAKVKRVNTRH